MARRQIVEEPKKSPAEDRTINLFDDRSPGAPIGREDGYRVVHTTEPGPGRSKQRMPAGCLAAKGDEPACEACGARLSVTNVGTFWPCGHGPAHEAPMAKGWAKDDGKPALHERRRAIEPGEEPGHGASPLENERGEILYCSECRLAQFMTPSGATCAQGHGGAPGMTAMELRAKGGEPGPERVNEPRPNGGSRYATPEPSPGRIRMPEVDESPMTLTVVWGKELYSPKQFHTYEVGPFSAVVTTRPGESMTTAFDRAYGELLTIAERERERKRKDFERAAGIK